MRTQIECSVARVVSRVNSRIHNGSKNSTSDKDTPYEEELELLNNEEEELDDQKKSLSDVLKTLNKSLATMATSMVAMERSVKRSAPIETSDSESSLAKKRKKQATKRIEDDGQGTSSEDSDSETLRKTTKQRTSSRLGY